MARITIHCIRHAQGYHNLNLENHKLPDPSLTPLGEAQCRHLAIDFPHTPVITHLVASPLRRTIYTTLLSLPTLIHPPSDEYEKFKVIAVPELQETSDLPCDTGSSPSKLEEEFGKGKYKGAVDLSRVESGWNSKTGKWSPAASAIEARALEARKILRELGQTWLEANPGEGGAHIVVTTHGGFLHYFTEDWEGNDKFTGTGWANTEFRSYHYVDERHQDERASIKETTESRIRRLGTEKPLSEDEQRRLRDNAEREWGEAGYQSNGTLVEESAKL